MLRTPRRCRFSRSRVDPAFVKIARDDAAFVLHQLREVTRLASGSRAGIEHPLAGLRREKVAGHERARILHVTEAMSDPGERQRLHLEHAAGAPRRLGVRRAAQQLADGDLSSLART